MVGLGGAEGDLRRAGDLAVLGPARAGEVRPTGGRLGGIEVIGIKRFEEDCSCSADVAVAVLAQLAMFLWVCSTKALIPSCFG